MTPNEIITEALYNIYGSSTPDTTVAAEAKTLMKRIYDDAQRCSPWWFLERFFTSPAVNQNISSFRPDGVLDFPGEVMSIARRNGLFVVLVKESSTILRLYNVDPKTLTVQKCGSFAKPLSQDLVELRHDESTDKLYMRLEDNGISGENTLSHIYEITEEGDIISTLTPTKPMNTAWDIYAGTIYYMSPAYALWDSYFQVRKLAATIDSALVDLIAGVADLCCTSDGIIVTKNTVAGAENASLSWIGYSTGTETVITTGGTFSTDKLARYEDNAFIASKPSDSDSVRVRWFDSMSSAGYPSYVHNGAVTISPWGPQDSAISESYFKNTVYFVSGNYMFIAERNTDGTASVLRLTAEKMGLISEITNSSNSRVKRVPVGSPYLTAISGSLPMYYTDEESTNGKRDISLFPQNKEEYINIRAIVYNDMEYDESDIVTNNLEDYLVKKLTAELSLKTEYADRYTSYASAAADALIECRRQTVSFGSQEAEPGYCEW